MSAARGHRGRRARFLAGAGAVGVAGAGGLWAADQAGAIRSGPGTDVRARTVRARTVRARCRTAHGHRGRGGRTRPARLAPALHGGPHLSVGCEFYLFVPGIVPGDTTMERVQNMLDGTYDKEKSARLLRGFIARSAAVGRSVFHGELTYGAARGDEVDWGLFDIVSVDYYEYHRRRADYVRELKAYQRWGKPVAIAECGSCTFKGAPEQGGMAWNNVDYEKQPPEIKGGLVRSERTQAACLADVFDVFESMGLYSATAFQFVTPDSPHRSKPLHDLDMVSYSLVRTVKDAPDDPNSDWHWEPKQSFHTLARHFACAARSGGARR